MRIFPVRHHSPAAALHLDGLVRRLRPSLILVEGPPEADALIDVLLDVETEPPVAIYAYRTGERVESLFYPLCAYSPEYVALRTGREIGAEVRFCDLPARAMLGMERGPLPSDDPAPDHRQLLAETAGFSDFEAFWEAAFEQDAASGAADGFAASLAIYGSQVRALEGAAQLADSERRERHMAAIARQARDAGHRDDRLLTVCGAFHVDGIARFYAHEAGPPEAIEDPAVEVALIPFSFPRLSEQTGYGAGNRAPWYYEQVWRARGDYELATRVALVELVHRLRAEGRLASLAQAIEAQTLARHLAALRHKRAPGADELLDAAIACFGAGDTGVVRDALRSVLIGAAVGRLSPRVGRTPLQSEFYATAQRLRLPIQDVPHEILVHLPNPDEAARSVFLHRLAMAGIGYARELRAGIGARGREAEGGALGSLSRALEKWQLQWTPSTDAQLIERSAWGSTFQEVCLRLASERLAAAARIDEGTGVVLQMALCALQGGFDEALARCEQLGGDSASFPALAQATYHLDGLLSYGAARSVPVERIRTLVRRLFARAIVHLPEAAACGDDGARELHDRLRAMHELIQRGSSAVVDAEPYWQALQRVAEQPHSHPAARGLALVLLEMSRRLDAGDLARRLHYWLGAANAPADAARLIAAVFSLHRPTLLRDRELIGAVTSFLGSMPLDELVSLLPILRGSLGNLSPRERDHLAATLGRVLGIRDAQSLEDLDLPSEALVAVRAADQAVGETLERWRTLYDLA